MDDTGTEIFRPILKWTVDDVFAMHRRYGVTPNPLYTQGMSRVGCMPCISCNKEELRQIAMRFPAEIERVAEWEALLQEASKVDGATFFTSRASEADGEGKINSKVEWSNTTKGKVQYLSLIHI